MKTKISLISLFLLLAFASKGQQPVDLYTQISIDKLISKAAEFEGKKVQLIGLVDHMCGVDGKKMKLKSGSGAVIKVVPNKAEDCFDLNLKKQLVSVKGVVELIRIDKTDIDKMEKEGALLCHIDHSPCKDKAWVNNKIESGKDVEMLKRDIVKLRMQMKESGKNDVSFICIRAAQVNKLDH